MNKFNELINGTIDNLVVKLVEETLVTIDNLGFESDNFGEFRKKFKNGYFEHSISTLNDFSRTVSRNLDEPTITYKFDKIVELIFELYSSERSKRPDDQISLALQRGDYHLDLGPARKSW